MGAAGGLAMVMMAIAAGVGQAGAEKLAVGVQGAQGAFDAGHLDLQIRHCR